MSENNENGSNGVIIKIGVNDGQVVVVFPKAITNCTFNKFAAYEFASAIMVAADQLGGPKKNV